MLVLTRRQDETVVIDGDITVTVIEIRGNQAKLGFDAPAATRILRGEIAECLASAPPKLDRE